MDCLGQKGSGTYSAEQSVKFFSNLSTAFNEQVGILDQVFPASVNTVVPFVQRIAKKVIAEYLTALFDEAHRSNIEAYLKAVSITCEQCLEFAKSLRPTSASGDDFYEAVDEVIIGIFEPHIDLYLREELEFFKRSLPRRSAIGRSGCPNKMLRWNLCSWQMSTAKQTSVTF